MSHDARRQSRRSNVTEAAGATARATVISSVVVAQARGGGVSGAVLRGRAAVSVPGGITYVACAGSENIIVALTSTAGAHEA